MSKTRVQHGMRFAKPRDEDVLANLYWLILGNWWVVEGTTQTDFHLIAIGLLNIVAAVAVYMDARLFRWPILISVSYASSSAIFDQGVISWTSLFAAASGFIGLIVFQLEIERVEQSEDPVHHIRTPMDMIGTLAFIIVPTFVLKVLTFNQMSSWWLRITMAAVTHAACEQFRSDNARNAIRGRIDRDVLIRATLAWTPILLLLLPAIVMTLTFDMLLGTAIQFAEFKTFEIHSLTQNQLSSAVTSLKEREYSWWWPPDLLQQYFDRWRLSLLTSGETLHNGSGIVLRGVFAFVHTGVCGMQIMSVIILSFVVSRSFLHVLFRVWLRQGGGEISFRMAYKARDAEIVTEIVPVTGLTVSGIEK